MPNALKLGLMFRVQHTALGPLVALMIAVPASAQEPGVTIDSGSPKAKPYVLDPGSPSAKQYVLPLESARRAADPKGQAGQGSGQAASGSPLFGAGVSRAATGGASGGSSSAGGSSIGSRASRSARPQQLSTGGPSRLPAAVQKAVSRPGDPGAGIGTTAAVLAAAALVLLAGLAAGLVARRRSS